MSSIIIPNDEIPLDWLLCPISKKVLKLESLNTLTSNSNVYHKDEVFGVWNFIPQNPSTLSADEWKVWQQLQNNGAISYELDPDHNLGKGARRDYIDFAKFCDFHGLVLDIGCGPQSYPTHMEYSNKSDAYFLGIDPLFGEQPRQFQFVQGLAEYLPFKNSLFDQILFVTSLDHFIKPLLALSEAMRVLQSNGEICIWIGEKSQDAPKPPTTNLWYESLSIPEGAEDRFHYKRLDSKTLEDYFNQLSLKISLKHEIVINEWKKNLLYKVKL